MGQKNKILVFLVVLICSITHLNAQSQFVRIYNMSGHKIGKGKITEITDSTITVTKASFHLKEIGYIKTKHSIGRNIGIGALTGFAAGVTLGIISYNQNKEDELAGLHIVAGAFLGTAVGLISSLVTIPFKRSVKYDIYGDIDKWKPFKENESN